MPSNMLGARRKVGAHVKRWKLVKLQIGGKGAEREHLAG
jgi:hypothetical protein